MMNKKTLLPLLLVPTCILAIPATAMLFKVEGWAWDAADFVIMGVLIAGAVAAYTFVSSKAPNAAYRAAAGIAVGTGLILIWINGAVGLIGSEGNPANLMYAGELALGLIGVAMARLQPVGMARAMFVTAAAQMLVPALALLVRPHDFSPGVVQVFALNSCFALLFLASALLFRHAAGNSGGARIATPA